MTQPRYIVPGMTVMVTRRTLRRTHVQRLGSCTFAAPLCGSGTLGARRDAKASGR